MVTSPEHAAAIHDRIPGAIEASSGTYNIPCELKGRLPSLDITINQHVFSVSSEDYVLVPTTEDEDMCVSGISGQVIKKDHWILGDVFIRGHYTVSCFRFISYFDCSEIGNRYLIMLISD